MLLFGFLFLFFKTLAFGVCLAFGSQREEIESTVLTLQVKASLMYKAEESPTKINYSSNQTERVGVLLCVYCSTGFLMLFPFITLFKTVIKELFLNEFLS